jgi:hypothetical protein
MNKYYRIFAIVIASLFIVLGFCLLFLAYFNNLPRLFRTIFAIFTISYGIYRLVMLTGKADKQKDEED